MKSDSDLGVSEWKNSGGQQISFNNLEPVMSKDQFKSSDSGVTDRVSQILNKPYNMHYVVDTERETYESNQIEYVFKETI
jgi:hypothetical protein